MPAPVLPRVSEHEVYVDGLDPRHDGVRIAQLSDIHVGNLTPAAHIRAAIASANAARPDLIVLTGDYVCWRRHEVALAAEQLGGLSAPRVLAAASRAEPARPFSRALCKAAVSVGAEKPKSNTISLHSRNSFARENVQNGFLAVSALQASWTIF